MGTSGPGIFADDVAADVRDEYLSMLAEGCTDKQAVQTILAEWRRVSRTTMRAPLSGSRRPRLNGNTDDWTPMSTLRPAGQGSAVTCEPAL